MRVKSQYQKDREAGWVEQGFTLIDEAKPEIGKPVEAVRVFQPRGFGGTIQGTSYKLVPIIRTAEYEYTDILNGDKGLPYSEFEGFRELQVYAQDGSLAEQPQAQATGDHLEGKGQ